MQAVEVDRGQNVTHARGRDIEFREQFDLSARDDRINAKLPCDRNKILLKDLERHDARPRTTVLGNQVERAPLFRGSRFVIRIDENIRIEETTSGHESHPG